MHTYFSKMTLFSSKCIRQAGEPSVFSFFFWSLQDSGRDELFFFCNSIPLYVCPHTNLYVSSCYYMCVLILIYMCPHTTICSSYDTYVSSYYYIWYGQYDIHVSSYYYICVLILYICVLILLQMCPHTTISSIGSTTYISYMYMYIVHIYTIYIYRTCI